MLESKRVVLWMEMVNGERTGRVFVGGDGLEKWGRAIGRFWSMNYLQSRRTLHLLTMLLLYGMGCSYQQVVSPVFQGADSLIHCQECSPVQFCKHSSAQLITLVPVSALCRHSPSRQLMGQMYL